MDVYTFVSDDVADDAAFDTRVRQFILRIVAQAMEREFGAVFTKAIINDRAHAAAKFSPKRVVACLIQIWEQAVLASFPGCFDMDEETHLKQVRMDRNNPTRGEVFDPTKLRIFDVKAPDALDLYDVIGGKSGDFLSPCTGIGTDQRAPVDAVAIDVVARLRLVPF